MYIKPSHWSHENNGLKTINHHFGPRLLEGKRSTGVYSSFGLKKLGELCTYVGSHVNVKSTWNGTQMVTSLWFGSQARERVQVWQILIKYCLFEPSFLPVLASHTTLLCSVLQFRNHSFWGREGGGRGGVGVSGGGHNNISDLFCMLDMLHLLNFLKSWQVLGVKVRIFFLFIQTFLGKQKFNLFWAQTTSKSIFKQVGKGAKGQEEVGWANVAKKL